MDYHYTEILKYKYERCAGSYDVKEYEFKIKRLYTGKWYVFALSDYTVLELLRFYDFNSLEINVFEWKRTNFTLNHEDLRKLIKILTE